MSIKDFSETDDSYLSKKLTVEEKQCRSINEKTQADIVSASLKKNH